MEIPGDIFKPLMGWVHQFSLRPVNPLIPWKMSKVTIDDEVDRVPTPNNAVPHYKTAIPAKKGVTGKVSQASFDPVFNIYGLHPFVAGLAITFFLKTGFKFRMACVPDTTTFGPLSLAGLGVGDLVGTPIAPSGVGSAVELPGAIGNPIQPVAAATPNCYIFLACMCTKIHHEADAAAGQPFDFDFETVHPYYSPGDSLSEILAYGYAPIPALPNTVGGGFW